MSRLKKTFKMLGEEPRGLQMGYILLPVGYAYNQDILKAKKGDVIRFPMGNSYLVFAVRRVKLSSALADILSRMRYGVSIRRMVSIWQQDAMLQGHGKAAISLEECIFLTYTQEEL